VQPPGSTRVPLGIVYSTAKTLTAAPTYGFGAQYRFGSVGVRADIQHSILGNLNPTTTSVGLTYSW
jgi:hypothetical protein